MALDPVTASILTLRDSDRERFERYQLNWMYYKAREYVDELGLRNAKEKKLFRHIAHVLGYVSQVVDTDARFVMKRRLSVNSPRFEEDILKVWERSNFQSEKYKLVRYGANLGDAFLILRNENPDPNGEVMPVITVANSEDMRIEKDPDDQTITLWAHQSYIFFDERGRKHVRDWIYYPDRVERYTDEKMDPGYPIAHPFGEVPVVHIKNIDIGEAYGLSSWHECEPQFDRVNQLGSYAERILLRYADPSLLAYGMTPGVGVPVRRGLNEDRIYYLDKEARMELLEYRGNVLPHLLELIDRIADNIKDRLPELSLSKIREQAGLSGYAVTLHSADFIAKVEELRGNYANGIEWINALAIRAMARSTAPLEEFANQVVFEPVFPVDRTEQLRAWAMEKDLGILSREEMLRRDGLTEKQIEQRLKEVDDDRGAEGYGLAQLLPMLQEREGDSGEQDNDNDNDDDEA